MEFLGPGQKPLIMPHYPHMLAEDVEVWSKFLEKMGKVIKRAWYDVHVGKPVDVPGPESDILRKVAAGVSRKRIDVVCQVASEIWVVEVKPYANMTALGQAYSYTRLLEREYRLPGKPRPVVVCDQFDEDMTMPYADLGVQVFVND